MKLGTQSSIQLILSIMTGVSFGGEVFISPDGSDEGKGTRDVPFATLERARTAVRSSQGEVRTVTLLPGRYRRFETFELDARDSGTKEAPVVYRAEKQNTVFIDGGFVVPIRKVTEVVSPSIKARLIDDVKEKILQIDLKGSGIRDYGTLGPRGFRRAYKAAPLELFINGKALTIARWPNEGEPHIPMGKVVDGGSVPRNGDYGMRPGRFKYETPRAERWILADDLHISGLFRYGYADDTIKVAEIDTSKGTFTTELPHLYGFANASFTSWFALNLIEEIDQPGEYCVDRRSGLLLFMPPAGFSKDSLIQISMLEEVMVAMEGVEHVRLENLTFENSRRSGVYIEGGRGNQVVGCTFRNLGTLAVQMGEGIEPFPYGQHDACGNKKDGKPGEPASRIVGSWHEHIYKFTAWDRNAGTDHRIQSCDIYDTGAGGILLGGGDRRTLTSGNNSVENCDIQRVNRLDRTYKAPVNVDGVGNRIVHNELHDCPGMAIYLHGNDHLIEFNRIHHVLTDISDQGAIYMGRDPSESGNMIRHNFFHDLYNFHDSGHGVQAIFFDDDDLFGATIYGNVFVRAGSTEVVKAHGGGEQPVINNIMVDCPKGLGKYRCSTQRIYDFMRGKGPNPVGHERTRVAVDVTKPPYSTKYPVVADIYNGKRELQFPYERNYEVRGDYSQFVDADNGNYALRENSTVFDKIEGFEPIPFEKIGLCVDEWRRSLAKPPGIDEVDLSAVEMPGEVWINFTAKNGSSPDGWLEDLGAEFGVREGGYAYGWSRANTAAARIRGRDKDPLRDSLVQFSPGAVWAIAVSNGRYQVEIGVGDPEHHSEDVDLEVETKSLVSNGKLKAREYSTFNETIEVRDGRLTLRSNNNPPGPRVTRLNYIKVRKVN